MSTSILYTSSSGSLHNPAVLRDGRLIVCDSESSSIIHISEDASNEIVSTGGCCTSACQSTDGKIFITDKEHNGLLFLSDDLQIVSSHYNEIPFHGPHQVVSFQSELFFTDPGHPGTTSLLDPKGSLFMLDERTRLLKPIAYQSLAFPSSITITPNGNVMYLCESSSNRILRFVRNVGDVWIPSVFHQLNGRVGPFGIDVDQEGNIYVGLCESEIVGGVGGRVVKLNNKGEEIGGVELEFSEVTGLCLFQESVIVSSRKTVYSINM
ncbi:hypothetical protein P9112_003384 [Eukaryota sp. TZLM1-RC]